MRIHELKKKVLRRYCCVKSDIFAIFLIVLFIVCIAASIFVSRNGILYDIVIGLLVSLIFYFFNVFLRDAYRTDKVYSEINNNLLKIKMNLHKLLNLNDSISEGKLCCDGVKKDSFYKNYDVNVNVSITEHFDGGAVKENLKNISLYDLFKSIVNECFDSLKSIEGKYVDDYFAEILNDIYNNGIIRHYYDSPSISLYHSSKGFYDDYSTIYEHIKNIELFITNNKEYRFEFDFELCS